MASKKKRRRPKSETEPRNEGREHPRPERKSEVKTSYVQNKDQPRISPRPERKPEVETSLVQETDQSPPKRIVRD